MAVAWREGKAASYRKWRLDFARILSVPAESSIIRPRTLAVPWGVPVRFYETKWVGEEKAFFAKRIGCD